MPAPQKSPDVLQDDEGASRCWWCVASPDYVAYHDDEWGVPVADDHRLFEKICLEGFQAGLSWLTILRKREAFRAAFHGFEIDRVARLAEKTVDRLTQNAGIVRHRGKIESTVNNARRATEMLAEFDTLADFFVQFRPRKRPKRRRRQDIPPVTDESTAMSKELKRRGWSFVGPTTCYAFMQAMGLVNDHLVSCHRWQTVEELQVAD